MLISGKTAKSREIPIVLDPVGVGISKFRTSAVHKIITEVKPDIIRLNASELKSICLNIKNMSGVDAVNIDSLDDTVELAKKLSLKTNAIIGVSGISDIVTDGKNTAVISGGHAMMKKLQAPAVCFHLLSVHLPPQIRIIFLCGICCIRFICKLRKKRIQRKYRYRNI